mmetsp:Transcript_20430/g.44552  ORF Transcript_20430/g.44552 Transcript_20430/m.44552 type:complete len:291 (-) Transcript_20430:1552-2424(-)
MAQECWMRQSRIQVQFRTTYNNGFSAFLAAPQGGWRPDAGQLRSCRVTHVSAATGLPRPTSSSPQAWQNCHRQRGRSPPPPGHALHRTHRVHMGVTRARDRCADAAMAADAATVAALAALAALASLAALALVALATLIAVAAPSRRCCRADGARRSARNGAGRQCHHGVNAASPVVWKLANETAAQGASREGRHLSRRPNTAAMVPPSRQTPELHGRSTSGHLLPANVVLLMHEAMLVLHQMRLLLHDPLRILDMHLRDLPTHLVHDRLKLLSYALGHLVLWHLDQALLN